ncbi:MAG: hypothetical protein M3Z36_13215, partial [Acidobacteriota bacterium]|nr:hypothetical protein [Acidobacteriota bacterium]
FGDQISTLDAGAILVLRDRMRFTMASHSTAKIIPYGNRARVTVVSGAGRYSVIPPTTGNVAAGTATPASTERPERFGAGIKPSGSRRPDQVGEINEQEKKDKEKDEEDKHKKHPHPSPTH